MNNRRTIGAAVALALCACTHTPQAQTPKTAAVNKPSAVPLNQLSSEAEVSKRWHAVKDSIKRDCSVSVTGSLAVTALSESCVAQKRGELEKIRDRWLELHQAKIDAAPPCLDAFNDLYDGEVLERFGVLAGSDHAAAELIARGAVVSPLFTHADGARECRAAVCAWLPDDPEVQDGYFCGQPLPSD